MKKKLLTLLLSLALVVTMMPMMALTSYATDPVCKIGTTNYSTIQDAIDNAGPEETTIELTSDVTITNELVVYADKNIILKLAGKTITANGCRAIRNLGVLKIQDPGSNGKICAGSADFGAILKVESGSASLQNGTLAGGNATANGGGVCVNSGAAFTLESGTITGCTATGDGGGVFVATGGTFTIKGGLISQNNAVNGAGVYANTGSKLSLNSARIKGNVATGDGGGLYLGSSLYSITGGDELNAIEENKATNGGGIYYNNSYDDFTLTNWYLNSNVASNYGGGIYTTGNALLILGKGSAVANNQALSGGGVFADGKFDIVQGDISGNKAIDEEKPKSKVANGGGIYISAKGQVEMSSGTIINNTADAGGGGAFIRGFFTLKDGKIEGNKASLQGGGVYVYGKDKNQEGQLVLYPQQVYSRFIMENGQISANEADMGAGVFVDCYDGTMEMTGGTIYSNSVKSYGRDVCALQTITVEKNARIECLNIRNAELPAGRPLVYIGEPQEGFYVGIELQDPTADNATIGCEQDLSKFVTLLNSKYKFQYDETSKTMIAVKGQDTFIDVVKRVVKNITKSFDKIPNAIKDRVVRIIGAGILNIIVGKLMPHRNYVPWFSFFSR